MKQSMRAKRMQRHHKRNSGKSKLSLVSLMDIFTILVFFLMLNASDVQVLQVNDEVKLPESIATTPAKETLLLLVSNSQVILQGKLIANTADLISDSSAVIDDLILELDYHTGRKTGLSDDAKISQSITIMGDSAIEYSLLKRIMQSCAQAGYTNIALAVENTTDNGSALSSPVSSGPLTKVDHTSALPMNSPLPNAANGSAVAHSSPLPKAANGDLLVSTFVKAARYEVTL